MNLKVIISPLSSDSLYSPDMISLHKILRYARPTRHWFNATTFISMTIFLMVFWYTSYVSLEESYEKYKGAVIARAISINVAMAAAPEATTPAATKAPTATTPPVDLQNMTNWLALQESRRNAVKAACKDIPKDVLLETIILTPGSREYLLVDDVHRAIYCFIPKVASQNWRKTWLLLTGLTSSDKLSSFGPNEIKSAFKKKTLAQADKIVTRQKLLTYKKMMVVRHPLERLFSVYDDEVRVLRTLAHAVYPSVLKIRPLATLEDIKWQEFVDHIIKEGVINNGFWLPFEELCHPCALDYDYIIKFETFQVDSQQFLKSINASSSIQVQEPTPENPRVNSSVLEKNMAQLTDVQKIALRRKYERDFLLFQYN